MQLYKFAAYFGALVWLAIGLLTIGSIIHGTIGLAANISVGLIFAGIGYYLYLKAKNTTGLLINLDKLDSKSHALTKQRNQFLLLEKIFAALSLLFGLILITGVLSRVFGEHMPIFG